MIIQIRYTAIITQQKAALIVNIAIDAENTLAINGSCICQFSIQGFITVTGHLKDASSRYLYRYIDFGGRPNCQALHIQCRAGSAKTLGSQTL